MTPKYFREAFDNLRSRGIVSDLREFTAMIGVGPQWLYGLTRKRSRDTRVHEKIVIRFKHRLDWFERTAPRPLKPVFRELQDQLRLAEDYTKGNFSAMYDRSRSDR